MTTTQKSPFKVGKVARSLVRLGFVSESDVTKACTKISEKKGVKLEEAKTLVMARMKKQDNKKQKKRAIKAVMKAVKESKAKTKSEIKNLCESGATKVITAEQLYEEVQKKLAKQELNEMKAELSKYAGITEQKNNIDENADVFLVFEGKRVVGCYDSHHSAKAAMSKAMKAAPGGVRTNKMKVKAYRYM